jgi:hypothetical protein
MTDRLPPEVTVLTDVNVLAIGLTDDHPVHGEVYPWIRDALDGPNVLLVADYYPLRTQYIMTNNFGVDDVEYLLTTDSDFDELCAEETVRYVNPVPEEKREQLALTDA